MNIKKIYNGCSFWSTYCVIIDKMMHHDPFDELLERYRGLIFSLCRRFNHRGLEVEDLVQEATIALWKAHERVLPLPKMQQAALVWRIAHNAVVDSLRRIEDTDALPEEYDEVAEEENPHIRELHEQIALLDEPNRTIVQMQLEGYSYEEIGQKLGLTEKNISVRLVRIKEELRKKMTL